MSNTVTVPKPYTNPDEKEAYAAGFAAALGTELDDDRAVGAAQELARAAFPERHWATIPTQFQEVFIHQVRIVHHHLTTRGHP